MDVIELANKISTQTVDIYNSAKKAQDSIQKTSLGVSEVMDKNKRWQRQSFKQNFKNE